MYVYIKWNVLGPDAQHVVGRVLVMRGYIKYTLLLTTSRYQFIV
jgi:hypothetical protein